jgi:hypothetical protein
MLKLLGRILFLGLVAGAVYALWKKLTGADDPYAASAPAPLTAVPTPAPVSSPTEVVTAPVVAPEPESASAPTTPWVEPDDGACPVSHPVKAKLSSGIFHVPGGQNYDRTKADRCYADATTAETDGLRQAKR